MSNELIKIFEYHGAQIRTEIDEHGEPWFCLKDVCDILGISQPSSVARELDEEDRKIVILNTGNRGNPNMVFVSETGLYECLLRSRKPEAREFKRWVVKEVLPSIRKNGGYLTDQAKTNPVRLMRSMSPEERASLLVASFQVDVEEADQRAELERQRRIQADEERRKSEARAQGAIADNTKIMHNYRELERRYEFALRKYESVCKHMYKGLKEIQEREQEDEADRPDMLSQHDAEDRVEKPISRRSDRNNQWVNNFYAPPPKKDDE